MSRCPDHGSEAPPKRQWHTFRCAAPCGSIGVADCVVRIEGKWSHSAPRSGAFALPVCCGGGSHLGGGASALVRIIWRRFGALVQRRLRGAMARWARSGRSGLGVSDDRLVRLGCRLGAGRCACLRFAASSQPAAVERTLAVPRSCIPRNGRIGVGRSEYKCAVRFGVVRAF
jgi:hypothetical protein